MGKDKKKTSKQKIKRNIGVKASMDINTLKESMKNKQVFDVYVKDVDRDFNLIIVFANGIEGVMPREEVSTVVNENGVVDSKYCLSRKEKIMQACIKDILFTDDKIDQVILSRKILEMKVRTWMYNNLKAGMKLYGIVTGMTDYAAFVDVGGGVKAILKVEDISHVRINKAEEKLRIGQRITGLVKKFDKDTGRIEISMKDLAGSFKARVKSLKEGDIVEGTVRGRTKTGIFIELKNDLTAMADHISEIEYGQKVLVYIKRINLEKERIRTEIIG